MGDITTGEQRPLWGVRVLDLASGPMAAITRQFAELGADVIRIEPADGAADRWTGRTVEGISLAFVAGNLGKRAATGDNLAVLAADADILVADRDTIDSAALRATNPALVIVAVSDLGATGRYTDWRAPEPVLHALSGELSRSGIPGRPPLLPPGNLATECAAVQAAYVALLAYYNALRTGEGDHLDFSILDGANQALDPGYGIAGSATAGVPASKLPPGRPEARHMYPILPCRDGFVRLCVLAPRQWQGMFEWMGRPPEFADASFAQLQARFSSTTLLPAIARLFADKTRAQIESEGQRFGVPAAAVLDLDEALQTEQMLARKAFAAVSIAPGLFAPFPDGTLEVDGKRMGITSPAPGLPEAKLGWRQDRLATRVAHAGTRPLEGLKVLDFGVIVVGAEAGRLLADQGADVIKVESSAFPDGSRQNRAGGLISPTFATGHRNKRSLAINVRDPRGKALLLDLIRDTDVLLSNFKGGTLQSLGLDYASLKTINPAIIVTDSSAFGPTGPWAKRMGYGPLVRASAGLTMQWRYPGEPDSFSDAITVYPDHVAGRIGVIGVLALMIRRLRTGVGGQVSVSQAEVMLSHMADEVAAKALEQQGHSVLLTKLPESSVYPCKGDDQWCVVSLRGPADERVIAEITGARPLADWLAEMEPVEAMERLQQAGIAAGAMLRVSELPEFEYYKTRGFFREARHPHMKHPFQVEGVPIRSTRLPDPPEAPAPLMGEHTADVLRERLGMDTESIEATAAAGAVELLRLPVGA